MREFKSRISLYHFRKFVSLCALLLKERNRTHVSETRWPCSVVTWTHFPCYWPFVKGIHRLLVDSAYKGTCNDDVLLSLLLVWRNSYTHDWVVSDLRLHDTYVTSMWYWNPNKMTVIKQVIFLNIAAWKRIPFVFWFKFQRSLFFLGPINNKATLVRVLSWQRTA